MVKRIKLEYIHDYDFLLLGISSYSKDYQLIWEINQKLGFDFERSDDHRIFHPKSRQEQFFSRFTYEDELLYLSYVILSNRSVYGFLLADFRNIDYLLVITGDYSSDYSNTIRNMLAALEKVQGCFILKPENIRDYERVL